MITAIGCVIIGAALTKLWQTLKINAMVSRIKVSPGTPMRELQDNLAKLEVLRELL